VVKGNCLVMVTWWVKAVVCGIYVVVLWRLLVGSSGARLGRGWWWFVMVVRVWFGWYRGGNSGLKSNVRFLGGWS